VTSIAVSRPRAALGEARKLPAFIRRDFLTAWSYRMAFFSDAASLVGQALVFSFISMMIEPDALPTYGGNEVTYLEFASIGIALGVFVQFALYRVAVAVRGEQLMGTLESVLMTPTSPVTIQLGSVAFDLLYIPIRTTLFLGGIALVFGLHFQASGIVPAILILLAFIPFVWGLGVLSAAAILTFRRGSGVVGLATLGLALVSGIYFPIDLLPAWIVSIAELNPIALSIQGMREQLLGGASSSEGLRIAAILVPMSLASLAAGMYAFRVAVRRELRRGSLGLY
jgi:ABC-2 type transport system permease protein